MTCDNNIVFSVLYGNDVRLMRDLLRGCMDRLALLWYVDEWQLEFCRVVFFLLLDADIGLKDIICKGVPGIAPMPPRKAEAFFMALRDEAIDPFFTNTLMTHDEFLSSVKNLYLVC